MRMKLIGIFKGAGDCALIFLCQFECGTEFAVIKDASSDADLINCGKCFALRVIKRLRNQAILLSYSLRGSM